MFFIQNSQISGIIKNYNIYVLIFSNREFIQHGFLRVPINEIIKTEARRLDGICSSFA